MATDLLELDLRDKKILYELDSNSRQSFKQIAKQIGTSKEVVQYRIKNLIKRRVIHGFYTVIDSSKLGYYTLRVYFRYQNTVPEREEEILSYLCSQNNTAWVARSSGTWDVIFGIWVKNLQDFNTFWLYFENKFRGNIKDKKVSVFTSYLHYPRDYLIGKTSNDISSEAIGNFSSSKLDDIDKKLLYLVASNARAPLVELSKKLELTSEAISYRLKQLIKKEIILGFRVMINLNNIGYQYYKVDMEVEDLNLLKKLEAFTRMHPNIVYSEKTIGGADFELDIEVRNYVEFNNIINQLKVELGGKMRNYEYYLAIKIYKTVYMPSQE